ncbi:MAG: cysteine desulfurase NifS [Smithella sp.]
MIYLDNNATTSIAPDVLNAMMPFLTTEWGNPSSSYKFGSKLKAVIEKARGQVAELIGAYPSEIFFTSCATESNNTAIHAALKANPSKRRIITSVVEHSSVLNYCRALEADGYKVTYLPVDSDGLLHLTDLEEAITEDTAIVSLMWANNETGVLFPVDEIAEMCCSKNVLYHCDAVQAVGKLPINLKSSLINYLSISGHKFHSPKGIGALFVRKKSPFAAFMHGGHQERGLRGGTENVALIVGIGTAAELARKALPAYDKRVRPLRDLLENEILNNIANTELNGHKSKRLANTTNISFKGIEAEALLILLDQSGICASSGSACLADSDEPSHVIKAMKKNKEISRHMIRFSLSAIETQQHITSALNVIEHAVNTLRI